MMKHIETLNNPWVAGLALLMSVSFAQPALAEEDRESRHDVEIADQKVKSQSKAQAIAANTTAIGTNAANIASIQLTPGPIGLTGANGATGPQGATGSQGLTGAAGINGTNGANGIDGATGAQGLVGLTGAAGTNGTNGTNGIDGAKGATGAQGLVGLTGSTGATGAVGPQGAKGAQGLIGLTGAAGTNGTNGTNGIDGTKGATGAQGLIGLTGSTGAVGPKGATGLTGAAGTNGTNGTNGIDGAKGATGAQGLVGLTGSTGAVGPKGAKGAQGLVGLTGAVGPKGAKGAQGLVGLTGAVGPKGAKGIAGAQGLTGAPGTNGTNGTNGIDGAIGPKGADGISIVGPAGADGAPGSNATVAQAVYDAICANAAFVTGVAMPSFCPVVSKTIFVTSTIYRGNLGGPAGANAKCDAEAARGGLTGPFRAFIQYSSTDSPFLATSWPRPNYQYVNTSGVTVAHNFDQLLSGSLGANIETMHAGQHVLADLTMDIWTGVSVNSQQYNCLGFTSSVQWLPGGLRVQNYGSTGVAGPPPKNTFGGAGWYKGGIDKGCEKQGHIMCVQQ